MRNKDLFGKDIKNELDIKVKGASIWITHHGFEKYDEAKARYKDPMSRKYKQLNQRKEEL